jgi:DNA-binding transcriptional regulator/RsmH inhibitor MraZ
MYSGKVDTGGRLKLPVPFQTYLNSLPEKGLFVTSTDRITAQIFPIAVWHENLKLLFSQTDKKKHATTILFNAQAFGADAEMDSQGRVAVNSELRKKLDLDTQGVHFYMEDGHIQILNDTMFAKMNDEAEADSESAIEIMKGAGLQ